MEKQNELRKGIREAQKYCASHNLKEIKKLASAYANDEFANELTNGIEKQLELLNILLDKKVNIELFTNWIDVYDEYEIYCDMPELANRMSAERLSKYEFDFLKEMLL